MRSIEEFKFYGMCVAHPLEVAVDGCTVAVAYSLGEREGKTRIVANLADDLNRVDEKLAAVLEKRGIKCVSEDGSVRERTSRPSWQSVAGKSKLRLLASDSSPVQSATREGRLAVGATDDGTGMQFFRGPRLGPVERLTIDGWSFVGQRTRHPSIHFMLAEAPGFRDSVELRTGSQSYAWLVRVQATGKLAATKGTHVKGPPDLRAEFEREIELLTSDRMQPLLSPVARSTVRWLLAWHRDGVRWIHVETVAPTTT
jgi:hypothetical protein